MRAPTDLARRGAAAAVAAGALAMAAAPAATAAPDKDVDFFRNGKASAKWSAPSDDRSIALAVGETVDGGEVNYAGVELLDAPSTLPENEPTFEFSSTVSGGSGGSPRLVVVWEDGGTSALRPLTWTADTWTTVSGSLWEDNTGCSEGTYNLSYAQVQTCHAGDTIESVFVVTDSGWMYEQGYTNYVDDISFGEVLISEPSTGKKAA